MASASVEWICGDVLQTAFPAHLVDLVWMQYPAQPKAAGEAAVRTSLDTVRPAGLLLAERMPGRCSSGRRPSEAGGRK